MLSTQCVLVIILLPGGGEIAESASVLTKSLNEPPMSSFGPEMGNHTQDRQDPPRLPGVEDLQPPRGSWSWGRVWHNALLGGGVPRGEDAPEPWGPGQPGQQASPEASPPAGRTEPPAGSGGL